MRQPGDNGFRTGPTATYPPQLCGFIADIVMRHFVARRLIPPRPSEGRSRSDTRENQPQPERRQRRKRTASEQDGGVIAQYVVAQEDSPREAEGSEIDEEMDEERDAATDDNREEVMMTEAWSASGPPPEGSGWTGVGAPVQVDRGSRQRGLRDGGGLCSPGRWPKAMRRFPDVSAMTHSLINLLRTQFTTSTWMEPPLTGQEAFKALVAHLACGRMRESPFTEDLVEKARAVILA